MNGLEVRIRAVGPRRVASVRERARRPAPAGHVGAGDPAARARNHPLLRRRRSRRRRVCARHRRVRAGSRPARGPLRTSTRAAPVRMRPGVRVRATRGGGAGGRRGRRAGRAVGDGRRVAAADRAGGESAAARGIRRSGRARHRLRARVDLPGDDLDHWAADRGADHRGQLAGGGGGAPRRRGRGGDLAVPPLAARALLVDLVRRRTRTRRRRWPARSCVLCSARWR